MRNKVRKSLAFLLALALVVSVMSGLGLSVSAEQKSNTPGTEEVQQQDKTEAGAAPSEVKAEEEAAKPEEKPVLEEKEDEQKTEAKENADKPAEKWRKNRRFGFCKRQCRFERNAKTTAPQYRGAVVFALSCS